MTTQAMPPSEAQQLADARIAVDLHITRITELEALVGRLRAERDALSSRLFSADHTLADMVNQYMSFPGGFISHEFMRAQEDAIDYLETIGWLRDDGMERYVWTAAAIDATKADAPSLAETWQAEKQQYMAQIAALTQALDAQAQQGDDDGSK